MTGQIFDRHVPLQCLDLSLDLNCEISVGDQRSGGNPPVVAPARHWKSSIFLQSRSP